MERLPNNCRVGKISVFPKNWKDKNANKKLIWRIWYRFYDDNLKQSKKIVIKGMNRTVDLKEKQEHLQLLLTDEIEELKNGYNPILKKQYNPVSKSYQKEINSDEVNPNTPFIKALELAHKDLQVVHQFWIDIKSTIKYIGMSASDLNLDQLPIKEISRKHIKRILTNCAVIKENWSANLFNVYRRDLTMLFVQLLELEAVDTNPVRDIAKQKTVKKIKRILTTAECRKIDKFTKKYDRRFWLLINIFFHSGSRTTEMFRVRLEHVNLKQQTVLYTVLKGNRPFEVLRPIKNIALPFWKEACKGAKPGDYIFGEGLQPRPKPISPRQATIRWNRHIKGDKKKGKLGLICNWYDLKRLNTDQVDEQKGLRLAAKLNSHKNLATTKLYAVNSDARDMAEIRKIKNAFTG